MSRTKTTLIILAALAGGCVMLVVAVMAFMAVLRGPIDPGLAGKTIVADGSLRDMFLTPITEKGPQRTAVIRLSDLPIKDVSTDGQHTILQIHPHQFIGITCSLDLQSGLITELPFNYALGAGPQHTSASAIVDGRIYRLTRDSMVRFDLETQKVLIIDVPTPLERSELVVVDERLAYQTEKQTIQFVDHTNFELAGQIELIDPDARLVQCIRGQLLISDRADRRALVPLSMTKFDWSSREITYLPQYRGLREFIGGAVEDGASAWYIANTEIPYQTILINVDSGIMTKLPGFYSTSMIVVDSSEVPVDQWRSTALLRK